MNALAWIFAITTAFLVVAFVYITDHYGMWPYGALTSVACVTSALLMIVCDACADVDI